MTFTDQQTRTLLIGFSAITVVSLLVGLAGNWWFLAGVPALVILAYLLVVDYRCPTAWSPTCRPNKWRSC